ncbi:radical SAM protein [bacterium]|nr:radical SAM protein [candidate division CSSED10-310 bacterium]
MNPSHVMVLDRSCTNGCRHCYTDPGRGNLREARRISLEARALGYQVFFYPTRHTEECFELQRILGQESEGLIARESWITALDERFGWFDEVEISLHDAIPDVHDRLHGEDGSFARTINAVTEFKRRFPSVTLSVWATICKPNHRRIEALAKLCLDLGVEVIYLIKLWYMGRARRLGPEWFLTSNEIGWFLDTVDRLNEHVTFKGRIGLAPRSNWGLSDREIAELRRTGETAIGKIGIPEGAYCPAGRQTICIDSRSGVIYPCQLFCADDRFRMGSWSAAGPVLERRLFDDLAARIGMPCRECDAMDICGGGCRAEAISEYERLTGLLDLNVGFTNCRRYLQAER